MARTREEIKEQYKLGWVESEKLSVIESPGEFEGNAIYVPHYWDLVLEGAEDGTDDDGASYFDIDASDVERWPELKDVKRLWIWKRDDGFVCADTAGALSSREVTDDRLATLPTYLEALPGR